LEFIVISLFYTTAYRNKRKFIIAILTDTRLIAEPGALLKLALYLVNLQGTVAPYPRVHLLIVEIVTCDVVLESQEKKIV